jgi:hypothetical protein
MTHTHLVSDHFATGPFPPHGRIELWAEGNVVRLTATGPFNVEAIQAMAAAWRALCADLPEAEPFADVVTVKDSIMASPEVLDAIGRFLNHNSEQHIAPRAVAWIVPPDVEGASLMIPQFEHVFTEAGRRIAFFEDEASALAWVKTALHTPA